MADTWVTRSGEEILIADMDDYHLISTINMLHRKGYIGEEEAYLATPGCLISPELDSLHAEAVKRGII